ncbi:metallophosphoesterase family protein [Staphylothermus hellenicus]|uniref:Icc protein-like phosphoesterase n=1 Tax=Staphylothermus hellenicus (strain DSM 12710 / JCM 10830 / BK20S6-10-b1 / P8) TaxID=591019 RepID=D7DBD7_STAHD|nr:phosphoesterase [Staphylothermus hellenicus]ADI31484.1 Icc protein-like phosphoesterase [Staphylothermus hellenicus DSM 12710]
MVSKILAISNINGREDLIPYIVYLASTEKIDIVLFCGNIVSPLIIEEISKRIKGRVLGVAGNLDDPSVIKMLKSINGFIDGRIVEVYGLNIGGVGFNPELSVNRLLRENKDLDILVSFYPSIKASINNGVGMIDRLIKTLHPQIVVFGRGYRKCLVNDKYVFPGEGHKGFYALIKLGKKDYEAKIYCRHFQDVVMDNY